MDMGECQKYHDVALRADFERGQKKTDYFFDIDVNSWRLINDYTFIY